LKQRLGEDGMTVVASTPDEFTQFLKRESAKFGRVIETAGIKGSL
jgi:tripartite-type tricarboxylate transporter receptor subunit TctC